MAETIEVPVVEYVSLLKLDFEQQLKAKDEQIRELDERLEKAGEWESKYYKRERRVPRCSCDTMTGAMIEFSGFSGRQEGTCHKCGKRYKVIEADNNESGV